MQGTTNSGVGDRNPSATSKAIRIDPLLFLTGAIGVMWLLLSGMLAIAAPVCAILAAYFAVWGDVPVMVACVVGMLVSAIGWYGMRWVARGILERRRASAIIASVVMTSYSALMGWMVVFIGVDSTSRGGKAQLGIITLLPLVLALLLVATLRNRYWRRAK